MYSVGSHRRRGAGSIRRLPAFPGVRTSLLQRFAVVSLAVMVFLGIGMGYVAGQFVQSTALSQARMTASDVLRARLAWYITPGDLQRPMTGLRYQSLTSLIDQGVLSDRTVRVKVWNTRGTVIYSSNKAQVGRTFSPSDELRQALGGHLASDVSDLTDPENAGDRSYGRLLEVYVPIRISDSSPVLGAFEIYQMYTPLARQISQLQRMIYVMLAFGLLILYLLLFGIVRRGSNTISAQSRQLRRYTQELEDSYQQTIASLAAAVDARDATTEKHSERVTELAVALGRWLGMPEDHLQALERGALLHDVGKIGVSDSILLKPGKLTDEEWVAMRQHPRIGYEMLRHVYFLQDALPVVLYHHERWDGQGYPHGMKGQEIPLAARLFAVIDAYDAITSDRPYRLGASHDEAMSRIRRDEGIHFDPEIVHAFDDMMTWRLRQSARGMRETQPTAAFTA